MEPFPNFSFSFCILPLPLSTGFHPGDITLLVKPAPLEIRAQPKPPYDSVRVKKPRTIFVPKLPPKSSFDLEGPHLLFTAPYCPLLYRLWLQFIGQTITDRYIYFDNIRIDKNNTAHKCLTKRPEMQPYLRGLLHWAKKEQNVRTQMRKLVALWLAKRHTSRLLNTEDPATMMEPEKPVMVFDSKARGSYVFEASTIKRQLEENIGYCKWLVSQPQPPKNPLTNLPFHEGQLIEIFRQLKLYGLSSWILEGFKEHHYNLDEFLEFFRQPLRMRAVEQCRKEPTNEDTIDFVSEFIEDEFDYHDIPYSSTLTILKWALENKSELKYVRTWISVWAEYYKKVILHGEQIIRDQPQLIDFVHDMSHDLFNNTKMIRSLGHMRLEQQRAAQPINVLQTSQFELSNSSETISGPTITHTISDVNILISADAISDALLEALLRHAPPSD